MALEQRAMRACTERQCGISTAAENRSKVAIERTTMRKITGATAEAALGESKKDEALMRKAP